MIKKCIFLFVALLSTTCFGQTPHTVCYSGIGKVNNMCSDGSVFIYVVGDLIKNHSESSDIKYIKVYGGAKENDFYSICKSHLNDTTQINIKYNTYSDHYKIDTLMAVDGYIQNNGLTTIRGNGIVDKIGDRYIIRTIFPAINIDSKSHPVLDNKFIITKDNLSDYLIKHILFECYYDYKLNSIIYEGDEIIDITKNGYINIKNL